MDDTSGSTRCSRCGTEYSGQSSPLGLCPSCLMALGMSGQIEESGIRNQESAGVGPEESASVTQQESTANACEAPSMAGDGGCCASACARRALRIHASANPRRRCPCSSSDIEHRALHAALSGWNRGDRRRAVRRLARRKERGRCGASGRWLEQIVAASSPSARLAGAIRHGRRGLSVLVAR
jgi:hypothetical protein